MRIYISVDMEGIGGVVRPEQAQRGTGEYEQARVWLTREVNSAVYGAQTGGATEIWIKDAHARATNLIWDSIRGIKNEVRIVQGRTRPVRFPGLDSTFAGLFLVGYHAMAGTPDAVLDHTWDHDTHFYFNGVEVGEIAVDAAIAGAFGVPVALVTGDDKTAWEARGLLGTVDTATVKEAVTSQGAILYPMEEVCRRVQHTAMLACHRLKRKEFLPYVPALPLHFRMTTPDNEGGITTREAEGNDVRAVVRAVLDQS